MTSTAQCTKPSTETSTASWATIFEEVDASSTKSILFMKKVLALGVSNILYWRGLLPDEAFGDRQVGESTLKLLKSERDCPAALKIISWIRSSFEPIARGWLRNFYLVVRDKENVNTIETYTFKFQCNDDSELQTEVYRNDKRMPSAVENKTCQMLSNIAAVVKPLGPAPFPCMISIDVDFNLPKPGLDIPRDVALPGFKAVDGLEHKFDGKRIGINLGDIATAYHECKLQVRTTSSRLSILTAPKPDSDADQLPHDSAVHSGSNLQRTNTSSPVVTKKRCSTGDDTENIHATSIPEQVTASKRSKVTRILQCQCGTDSQEFDTKECTKCGKRQHLVCYGLNPSFDHVKAFKYFSCYQCSKGENKGSVMSLDERREVSLYRQALHLLYVDKASVTHPFLQNNQGVLNKLLEDKVLKRGRGQNKSYTIAKAQLRDCYQQYFSSLNQRCTAKINCC